MRIRHGWLSSVSFATAFGVMATAMGGNEVRAEEPEPQAPAAAPEFAPIPAQPAYPPPLCPPPGCSSPDHSPYAPGHHGMMGGPHHHFPFGESAYVSPGLAVVLSLQPLPIDFGNLYVDNIGWGVAYTAIEIGLLAPMMWIGASHMGHGSHNDTNRAWSDGDKATMIATVSGYVVVKLIAGLHAGYAARALNRANEAHSLAFVVPTSGGAVLGWGASF